ncbi:MAG: tRNA (adenosine(37)-N6)-dimethylallyltransferase MiaA [Candidatus Delongbacteria bacterium]|nr:tRNA (adenosine(37)-N6)-dimethylallyltransferase MiaA [Candidatus Delongbacteria bacterium]
MDENNSRRPAVIILAGPTASGKTEWGIELALAVGSSIISADSRQIYRWMDIGTAKPDHDQLARVPHHLIDLITPDQTYNAGLFLKDCQKLLNHCHSQSSPLPLIVGGTGLYIQTLLHGLAPIPDIPDELTQQLKNEMDTNGLEESYRRLTHLDPKTAAGVYPQDRQRIIRFLSICLHTGKSVSYWKSLHKKPIYPFDFHYIILQTDRDILYRRINQRVDQMIRLGLIDEVNSILNRGYSMDSPGLQTYGYREIIDYLQNRLSLTEAVDQIKTNTRHYAKRQMTWFNKIQDAHHLPASSMRLEQLLCLIHH